MNRCRLDQEYLDDVLRVARELGHVPSFREYNRRGRYNAVTIYRRFGSFRRVQEWVREVLEDLGGEGK